VFDILLHWVEERDWAKALYAVMPKRKFQQGSQSGGLSVEDEREDKEEVADEEVEIDAGMDDPKDGEGENGGR